MTCVTRMIMPSRKSSIITIPCISRWAATSPASCCRWVLTAIPFWLVMAGVFESSTVTIFVILALAMVQIYVHMVFFLHMTSKAEGGWTWMSLIFTLVLLVIVLSGSLWIMYHLKTNTMPVTPEQARKLP